MPSSDAGKRRPRIPTPFVCTCLLKYSHFEECDLCFLDISDKILALFENSVGGTCSFSPISDEILSILRHQNLVLQMLSLFITNPTKY